MLALVSLARVLNWAALGGNFHCNWTFPYRSEHVKYYRSSATV